ncbi:MAG: hypothetical protein ACI9QQ_000592 [Myxococcota bacterium]
MAAPKFAGGGFHSISASLRFCTMTKPTYFFLILIVGAGMFGAGRWSVQSRDPIVPTGLYRSTAASRGVEFSGVQGELRSALLENDILVREAGVATILQKIGPESAEQVFEVFESTWIDLGQTELILLGDWWARFDPHAAMEWAESDHRTARTDVPFAVLRSWATYDPNAAIARAVKGAVKNPKMRSAYEAYAIEGWEASGKPGLTEYIQGLGPNVERQRAITGWTRRMVMREGIDRSFGWAEALPDDDKLFKLNVLRRIASISARIDPAKASGWASKFDGTYYMRSLPQRIAMHWMLNDPLSALAWLKSLENGRNQDEGVREAFRTWLNSDRAAALVWLKDQKHTRWLDEALAMHARQYQLVDQEAGLELAKDIIRDDLRTTTQILIARTWSVVEEERAKEWLAKTNRLTEDDKERTLKFGEKWRQSIVMAVERYQRLDKSAAKARLDDWSDPDTEAERDAIPPSRIIENPIKDLT